MASEIMNLVNGKLDELSERLSLGAPQELALPKKFIINQYGAAENSPYYNAYTQTPEMKARKYGFMDPFIPNFKLMIDWSKPYGLFADEQYTNSALAYLKRAEGESGIRYLLLKEFHKQFKNFIKEYQFLILSVEGLDDLYNNYNKHTFVEENDNKITVNIRENVLMQWTGLLGLYDQIWYDSIRGVEVLPANLRRFDLYIMIYSAGYYNPSIYGDAKRNDDNQPYVHYSKNDPETLEQRVLPTIDKLELLERLDDPDKAYFNNVMFIMADAQIDMSESGKKLFSDVANEMSSEMTKTNLTVTSRFVGYYSAVKQIFDVGNKTVADLLALQALEEASTENNGNNKFKSLMKSWGKQFVASAKKQGMSIVNGAKNKLIGSVKSLFSQSSPIGNALTMLTDPEALTARLAAPFNAITSSVINKYVDQNVNWLQNMVAKNFNANSILTDLTNQLTDNLVGRAQEKKHFDDPFVTPTYVKPNLPTEVFVRPDEKIVSNRAQLEESLKPYAENDDPINEAEQQDEIPNISQNDEPLNKAIVQQEIATTASPTTSRFNRATGF